MNRRSFLGRVASALLAVPTVRAWFGSGNPPPLEVTDVTPAEIEDVLVGDCLLTAEAQLHARASRAIHQGELIESAGDGTVRGHGFDLPAIGVALEDIPAGGRGRVRLL